MAEVAAALESLDEHGNGVRVEFTWQGDRFGHVICGVRANESIALLQSIEGTPEDQSPPSPPFAELHQQADVLFLSGATTLGHWSMSVMSSDGVLCFDVACRAKVEPAQLGNTYEIVDADWAKKVDLSATASAVELVAERVEIRTKFDAESSFPMTRQWKYRVAAVDK